MIKHIFIVLIFLFAWFGCVTAQDAEISTTNNSSPDDIQKTEEDSVFAVGGTVYPYLRLKSVSPGCPIEFTTGELQLYRKRSDDTLYPYMKLFYTDDILHPEQIPSTSDLDSLTMNSRTECFQACSGDSLAFLFGSSIRHDIASNGDGWNVYDTLRVYFDIVDSANGNIVQTLDSLVIYPYNLKKSFDLRNFRHNIEHACKAPKAYPLVSRYAINTSSGCTNVCFQIRPSFGATAADRKPAFAQYVYESDKLLSVTPFLVYEREERQTEKMTARFMEMTQRHAKDYDLLLAKKLKIIYHNRMVDEVYKLEYTSTEAKQWNISIEDESGKTIHAFEPVYTFPNIKQYLKYIVYTIPKGFYLVVFRSEGKVAVTTPFVKLDFNEAVFDSATPTKKPITCD